MNDFAVNVHNELPIDREQEPVTLGVPFARGTLTKAEELVVVDESGQAMPTQASAQSVWGDGSVRWALIHFLGDLKAAANGKGTARYRVRQQTQKSADGNGNAGGQTTPRLKISPEPTRVRVDTGRVQFSVDAANFRGLEYVRIPSRDGKTWVAAAHNPPGGSLYMIDSEGKRHTAQNGRVTLYEVLEKGPLVCTIHIEGEMSDVAGKREGEGIVEYDLWIRAFAGSSTVRCYLTIRNPRAAVRRVLGHWPLGLEGSVYFKECGWQMEPPQDGVPFVTLHGGEINYLPANDDGPGVGITAVPAPHLKQGGAAEIYRGPFVREARIVQDSSGGENWFNRNHIDRNWQLTVNYKGWQSVVDGKKGPRGDRADAWIACEDPRVGLAMGMRHFWQNFPKAVRAVKEDGKVRMQLCFWPKEVADENNEPHELQGGEQKTHEFVLHFFRGDDCRGPSSAIPYGKWVETSLEMRRAIKPPRALAELKQYTDSGAFDYISPYDAERAPNYEAVNEGSLLSEPVNLRSQIEAFDEFGWRNFGDIIADGEINGRLLSHYNLEYDMGYAMLMQAIRTQEKRPDLSEMWWNLAEPSLRHESDMDVYQTGRDPHAGGGYNHGKHHHTDHAYEAGRSTHRAYEEDGMQGDMMWYSIRGGGPESGHMNSRGMLTYAWMSGFPSPVKVAKQMADLVVHKITTNQHAQIHEYSRTTGHNLQILTDGYHITGDKKYLDTGRHLIDVSHIDTQPWRNGFPVRRDNGEINRGASMLLWMGSIFVKEVIRFLRLHEQEGWSGAERAKTFVQQAAELHNNFGWDDQLGRYAHSVNGDGSQYRYREPWWDLKVLDSVVWASLWIDDPRKRALWMARAARNFDVAMKLIAPDPKHLPFFQSKCSTVAAQNGHVFLVLEKQLGKSNVPEVKVTNGRRPKAKDTGNRFIGDASDFTIIQKAGDKGNDRKPKKNRNAGKGKHPGITARRVSKE